MIAALLRATISVVAEIVKVILQLIESNPRVALIIAAVVVLLIVITSIPYFWVLLLGLVLVGAGLRLRRENL